MPTPTIKDSDYTVVAIAVMSGSNTRNKLKRLLVDLLSFDSIKSILTSLEEQGYMVAHKIPINSKYSRATTYYRYALNKKYQTKLEKFMLPHWYSIADAFHESHK